MSTSKYLEFILNKNYRTLILMKTGIYNKMDDEKYLKKRYEAFFNKKLNLDNPITFNEKIQWLKLNDRKEEYSIMVDKFKMRDFISKSIGEKYLIPLIGVWDNVDDIDFNSLPDSFVLKTTHDSGGVVICPDKNSLNIKKAKAKLKKHLSKNYFYQDREWPYKNVKPKIIAEKYMVDSSNTELKDFKVFNFNGKSRYIQVDYNRFNGHKKNIYDLQWNLQDFNLNYPRNENMIIPKPLQLEEMIDISELLSKNIPFLRTDFYVSESNLYIGELTFYPSAGLGVFDPEYWNTYFGNLLDISNIQKVK